MELKCPPCTACPYEYCKAERRDDTTFSRTLTPEETRWVKNGIAKLEHVAKRINRVKHLERVNSARRKEP